MSLLLGYWRSKPPVMLSLTDLVDMDKVHSLHFIGLAMTTMFVLILSPARLPLLPSSCVVFFLWLSIYAFVLYLVISVAVQYAHVYTKSASVLEAITEGEVQVGIRIFVFTASTLMAVWSSLSDSKLQMMTVYLMEGWKDNAELDDVSTRSVRFCMVLLLVSFTAIALMKLLIKMKKRQLECSTRAAMTWRSQLFGEDPKAAAKKLKMYILVSLLFAGILILESVLVLSVNDLRVRFYFVAMASTSVYCIFFPLLFILSHGKIRSYVAKKYLAGYLGKVGLDKVSPFSP